VTADRMPRPCRSRRPERANTRSVERAMSTF
jgi:hypothetical protein